jgi:hypothetical protein
MPYQKYYNKTTEELKEIKRYVDKTKKFKKYWLKNYSIKIKDDQIDMVMKYKSEIKKVLPIIDFIKKLDVLPDIKEEEEEEEFN